MTKIKSFTFTPKNISQKVNKMANVVNNLRINGKEVKKIFFNDKVLKEFYCDGVLI